MRTVGARCATKSDQTDEGERVCKAAMIHVEPQKKSRVDTFLVNVSLPKMGAPSIKQSHNTMNEMEFDDCEREVSKQIPREN